MRDLIVFFSLLGCFAFAKAQLGFCNGAPGEPIFIETFGQGTTNGPPLANMQTSYTYVDSGTDDGEYTISSNIRQLSSWHDASDHTPNDTNGKALIVNASFDAGQFYQTDISGLCENTIYEFSAWILNVYDPGSNACPNNEIPIQVQFEIWDATDTNLLAQGTMDPKFAEDQPTWIQYGLTFTTATGQNGCILKMINKGGGGCGNDLAIDDIIFRTCGDVATITDTNSDAVRIRCFEDPSESILINASTDVSVYDSPAYQWQSSSDGVIFTDIMGANEATFTTALIESTTFYRVKIAEDENNLNNSQCNNFSEFFEYRVVEVPPAIPVDDMVSSCEGDMTTLQVSVANGIQADWYDNPTGGTLLKENSNSYTTDQAGTYYVQTTDVDSGCSLDDRVAIELEVNSLPEVNSADFDICPGTMVTLDTEFDGPATYEWNTGEHSPTISVSNSGTYTCVVTTATNCKATATFTVTLRDLPEIIDLIENGDELSVITNEGNWLYSTDGINYQESSVLDITTLLRVNVRVKDQAGCLVINQIFDRIGIPEFFTPNADGFNDLWHIGNLENFESSRIEIYDRYGKFLKVMTAADAGWDGTFNNENLPSSDYWYSIFYEGNKVSGHFSLKR